MSPSSVLCFGFAVLFIVYGNVSDAARIARSPQFGGGGFSQAQASAQAGGFGFNRPRFQPGFGPPGPNPYRPGFGPGPRPFGQGGFGPGIGQGGLGQGGSISISKSISISRGGAAQSSAQSSAAGK